MSRTPLFVRFARPVYGAFLKRRYGISTEGLEKLKGIDGPCLVFSNHVHALDPFFISVVWPRHIRWVAGAHLFKNKALGFLLSKLVTSIPKQQGRSDYQTIKDISKAFQHNHVVGLFPEGTRTWDGEPYGFDIATAKLVRMFHVPVVLVNLNGGYGLKPRWALHPRTGRLDICVRDVILPEDIMAMKLQDIHERLVAGLGFSYRTWQQTVNRPFESPTSAEGLERVLYLCPHCNGESTMVGEHTRIRCRSCGFSVGLDPMDRFEHPAGGDLRFDDVPQWHRWEQERLLEMARAHSTASSPIFPADSGQSLHIGTGRLRLRLLAKSFTVTLVSDGVLVQPQASSDDAKQELKEDLLLPFKRVRSLVLNLRGGMEVYVDNVLYRIQLQHTASPLKYLEYYHAFKEVQQWNGTISST
jgi:1-acyl-sn-glycerol-3-phosphate acyltransferase